MALGWDLRGGDSSEFQAPTCALLSARITSNRTEIQRVTKNEVKE